MFGAGRRILLLVAVLNLSACDFLRGHAEGHSTSLAPYETRELPTAQLGAARFLFDDFGALNTDTLQTNAVPWKLVSAALVLDRYPGQMATQEHLRAVLKSYGFIHPDSVGNWPMQPQPEFRTPLGIVSGLVQRELPDIRIEVANLGCSSCHAGVTYDARGQPVMQVWMGMPNTSLDLDAYVEGVLVSLRAALRDEPRTFQAIRDLFPDVSAEEIKTLRKYVWPRLKKRVEAGDPGLPFRNGGPGRSNGVDALKYQFHLVPGKERAAAGVSIPQIGDVQLRWSLLADGIYTRHGDAGFAKRSRNEAAPPTHTAEIVAFFTVPTMGLHPDQAQNAIEPVTEVMNFLSHFQAPQFPGVIDEAAADRGERVYARCAACHGEYRKENEHLRLQEFPNRLSPLTEIGTDPARLDAVNGQVIAAVKDSVMGRFIDASETRGYIAPSLSGVWATAPYLHNGSVPSLDALLNPARRPAKFQVGGHALDFDTLGIAYPEGYLPWSTPHEFDTSEPGHANRGHEKQFEGLTDNDKRDLIEFLKRL